MCYQELLLQLCPFLFLSVQFPGRISKSFPEIRDQIPGLLKFNPRFPSITGTVQPRFNNWRATGFCAIPRQIQRILYRNQRPNTRNPKILVIIFANSRTVPPRIYNWRATTTTSRKSKYFLFSLLNISFPPSI